MASPPPDYGYDFSGYKDIDPTGAVIGGVGGIAIVSQALARRLSTPRGAVLDDPNYGSDLSRYVNDDVTYKQLAELNSVAQQECLKDERVLTVKVTSVLAASGILTVTVLYTTAAGPFSLVLSVAQTSVQVLTVT